MPFTEEINQLNTDIIAVSFGTPYWANAWLEETQAPFPIWLDPQKESYELYGMTSSALQAWGPQNLWFYAKAFMRGEKSKGNRGSTDQMGGNFIVDKNGIVRFAYPSKNPTDRPEIGSMINVLKTIQ